MDGAYQDTLECLSSRPSYSELQLEITPTFETATVPTVGPTIEMNDYSDLSLNCFDSSDSDSTFSPYCQQPANNEWSTQPPPQTRQDPDILLEAPPSYFDDIPHGLQTSLTYLLRTVMSLTTSQHLLRRDVQTLHDQQCSQTSVQEQNNQKTYKRIVHLEGVIESLFPLLQEEGLVYLFKDLVRGHNNKRIPEYAQELKDSSGKVLQSSAEKKAFKNLQVGLLRVDATVSAQGKSIEKCQQAILDSNERCDVVESRVDDTHDDIEKLKSRLLRPDNPSSAVWSRFRSRNSVTMNEDDDRLYMGEETRQCNTPFRPSSRSSSSDSEWYQVSDQEALG